MDIENNDASFDVFDDSIDLEKEASEEVVEPKEQEKPEEKEKSQGDKQDDNDEPPSSNEDKTGIESESEESWTKQMALDERRKRQDLEKTSQELKAQIAELQKGLPKKEEEVEQKPDVLDDPEAALKYTETSFDAKLYQQKIDMSRSFMKEMSDKFPDYDDMEKKFIELAKNDEHLSRKLRESSNPAKFAYDTAKNHAKNLTLNDPNYEVNLREKLRQEILEEIANGQNTKSESKKVVNIPSLNNATGTNSNVARSGVEELFSDSPF